MRVGVGVQESSKKKLVRGIWAGHVDKFEDEKTCREQMSRKWGETEARKINIAMGDCIKR